MCSYPPYLRVFFHPQPEDAPCCGDREPPLFLKECVCVMAVFSHILQIIVIIAVVVVRYGIRVMHHCHFVFNVFENQHDCLNISKLLLLIVCELLQ